MANLAARRLKMPWNSSPCRANPSGKPGWMQQKNHRDQIATDRWAFSHCPTPFPETNCSRRARIRSASRRKTTGESVDLGTIRPGFVPPWDPTASPALHRLWTRREAVGGRTTLPFVQGIRKAAAVCLERMSASRLEQWNPNRDRLIFSTERKGRIVLIFAGYGQSGVGAALCRAHSKTPSFVRLHALESIPIADTNFLARPHPSRCGVRRQSLHLTRINSP